MTSLVNEYEEIVIYVDGSSLNNPGSSGAGVVFNGFKKRRYIDEYGNLAFD